MPVSHIGGKLPVAYPAAGFFGWPFDINPFGRAILAATVTGHLQEDGVGESDWLEVVSYVASSLVFFAFFMKAIVPLRVVAIASNIAFIIYAAGAGITSILILHLALLPLNCWRVVEHLRLVRRVRAVATSLPLIEKLLPLMTHRSLSAGTVLFRKGDTANRLYYLTEGQIRFDEVGVEIGPKTVFGEIALFLQDNGRTATATCVTACEVYALSREKVEELVIVDPSFGLFLTKLIAERMNQNVEAERLRMPE